TIVTRQDELVEAFGLDVQAGYRSPGFSAMASFADTSQIRLNSKTLTGVLSYAVDFVDLFTDARPLQNISSRFDLVNRPNDFFDQCGTHYVQSVRRGVRLYAVVQLQVTDSNVQHKL